METFDENEFVNLPVYIDRERDFGTGEVRIGTSFELSEDMYSLLFIGAVKVEYIEYCYETSQARESALEGMIEEYRKKQLNGDVIINSEVEIEEIKTSNCSLKTDPDLLADEPKEE